MEHKNYLIFGIILVLGISLIYGCAPKKPPVTPPTEPPVTPPEELSETLPTPSGKWQSIINSDVAKVSNEWKTPKWVEINSEGWEDGAYISSDGNTLYFAYISLDLFKLPNKVVIGPNRDTKKLCKPDCGQFPRVDLFYSKKVSGKWQTPEPHPLTISYPVGGIVFSNPNKAYVMIERDDGLQTEIHYAEKSGNKWQSPKKISALSSAYKDDDPYVNSEDNEMFFWSDRPAELAGNNIHLSKNVNGEWQSPTLLPEPINSNGNDMQPFLFGNTLYFSSDRDGKLKIYMSTRTENSWSAPKVVIESKNAVGEPTLTADGKFLYFMQIFVSKDGTNNPEIMYTERK